MPMDPQGAPPQAPPQESPAAQMASQAFEGLSGILDLAKQAGQKESVQLLTQVLNGFQAAMEHLGASEGQGSPAPQAPGGPIQAGAAPDSQPFPY